MNKPSEPRDMHESIARGLEQSARGEVVDLGDFTQYVDDKDVTTPEDEAPTGGLDSWDF